MKNLLKLPGWHRSSVHSTGLGGSRLPTSVPGRPATGRLPALQNSKNSLILLDTISDILQIPNDYLQV
jgi:hypothetical protein